jgi:hypothetical protein
MQPPLWHVFVHDGDESIIMAPLNQMHEFVGNQVFKALDRFLDKLKI